MKRKIRLYAIGNAHIDPVWLWNWQEGYSETISTFKSAIARLREYPDFIFTAGEAVHYKWIEEIEPELFKEIKKYVKSGRWSIVNGWWVQPDCNIPSGESFVRHCLYGKKYFKERFGVDVTVGYNIDSFGHNATLPQILKKSGFKYYIFFRPDKNEKKLPDLVFWWKSKDGSKILACRPPVVSGKSFYCTGPGELKEIIDGIKNVLISNNHTQGLFFYGVGDHGGGPTKKNIESIKEYNKTSQEVKIEFSTIETFFESILKTKKVFPELEDELQHHAVGCYTAHSGIKKLNREAENKIYTAELLSSLGWQFLRYKYPQKELTECWHSILFNQFHDILCGTAIPEAYKHASSAYGHVLHITGRIIDNALRFIINKTSNVEKGNTGKKKEVWGIIHVLNPLSWKRNDYIKLHLYPYNWEIKKLKIYDCKGNILPSQIVKGESIIGQEVLIYLRDIPACGYKTIFWELYPNKQDIKHKNSTLKITNESIENNFWLIKIDKETGYIKSLYDKENKVEIFKDLSNIPVIINDKSDTWGHGVETYSEETGKFKKKKIMIEESGPERAVLKIISEYNKSEYEQDIVLYNHTDKIDFKTKVHWYEKFKMLKIKFILNLEDIKVTSSIPYGYIERTPDGKENTCQAWIDISGVTRNSDGKYINYGISFLNDSKYGYDIKDNILKLSILRSPVYAWDKGFKLEEHKSYEFMDQGEHFFIYQIFPHKNNWKKTDLVNRACELNIPLEYITYTYQTGLNCLKNVLNFSFIEIEPKTVMLTALKKCEKDNCLVLRVLETVGKDTNATIKFGLLNKKIKFEIKHNEIKTFKLHYTNGKIIILKETNLLEE